MFILLILQLRHQLNLTNIQKKKKKFSPLCVSISNWYWEKWEIIFLVEKSVTVWLEKKRFFVLSSRYMINSSCFWINFSFTILINEHKWCETRKSKCWIFIFFSFSFFDCLQALINLLCNKLILSPVTNIYHSFHANINIPFLLLLKFKGATRISFSLLYNS